MGGGCHFQWPTLLPPGLLHDSCRQLSRHAIPPQLFAASSSAASSSAASSSSFGRRPVNSLRQLARPPALPRPVFAPPVSAATSSAFAFRHHRLFAASSSSA